MISDRCRGRKLAARKASGWVRVGRQTSSRGGRRDPCCGLATHNLKLGLREQLKKTTLVSRKRGWSC